VAVSPSAAAPSPNVQCTAPQVEVNVTVSGAAPWVTFAL
jgi:hypothetical protein